MCPAGRYDMVIEELRPVITPHHILKVENRSKSKVHVYTYT